MHAGSATLPELDDFRFHCKAAPMRRPLDSFALKSVCLLSVSALKFFARIHQTAFGSRPMPQAGLRVDETQSMCPTLQMKSERHVPSPEFVARRGAKKSGTGTLFTGQIAPFSLR